MDGLKSYVNGKILAEAAAVLPVIDRGMLYGDGLFETLRVYGGRPFKLERHMRRLMEGARRLELPCPGGEELCRAAAEVIEANALREGSLRVNLTRGSAVRGLWPPPAAEGILVITAGTGIPYTREQYLAGFSGVTVSFPRNERSPLVRLKTLNFLENIMGKREAAAKGAEEGIFLNGRGEVTEGTASNLFVFDGRELSTPPVACGLLPGITREAVLQAAGDLQIPAKERVLRREEVLQAQEVFLTASLLEIMPMVSLDGRPIGDGRPGPVTKALREAYKKQVVNPPH